MDAGIISINFISVKSLQDTDCVGELYFFQKKKKKKKKRKKKSGKIDNFKQILIIPFNDFCNIEQVNIG